MKLPSRVASNPLSAALVTGALLAAEPALAIQSRYNMPPAVTAIAREIHWLHWFMIIICGVIFVAVFGVMFYSIWAHRKSRGHKPADFHESTTVEIVWTIIPFLIVIGMAIPATKTVVAMKDTTNADLTIKATGYQWKWGYDYLKGEGEGISFLSQLATPRAQIDGNGGRSDREANNNYLIEVDNDLVVPVDKKVRIITDRQRRHPRVDDPGVRRQAGCDSRVRARHLVQGREDRHLPRPVRRAVRKDHAFMPIVVRVVSAADYTKWVGEKQKELAAQADDPNKTWTSGGTERARRQSLRRQLLACHQANGQGVPGCLPGARHSAVVHDKAAADRDPPQRQERHAVLETAVGRRARCGGHLHPQRAGATRTNRSSQPNSRRRASKRVHESTTHAYATRGLNERSRPRSRPRTRPRHDHEHGAPHGWRRWLYATNHKDIGTLYLWFSFIDVPDRRRAGADASAPSCSSRACSSSQPEFFNQLTTMHGLVMVFGAIMPAFVGFANWMVPLQIGAPDMAFARMNNFSSGCCRRRRCCWPARSSCPAARPPPAGRCTRRCRPRWAWAWTWPSSRCTSWARRSIMGSINIITTILNMRAPA